MWLSFYLLGTSKTNSILAQVVNRVVASEESISKNNERTSRFGDVHSLEGRDTGTLKLQYIVGSRETVVGTGKVKGDVRQRLDSFTLNGVLAVPTLLSANLLVQQVGQRAGENVQGSAGVKDGASAIEIGNFVTKSNRIDVDLPVSFAAEGNVLNLAGIVGLVNTTKGHCATLVAAAEIEGEDRLVQELLVNHVVKRRDNLIDRNGVIAETKDSIKSAEGESQAGFLSCLSKVLILDFQVTNGHDIVGDKTRQAARAVPDLEARAILLVG